MKTQKTKSWKGHWVAVHPDLANDAAGMQGKIGKVQQIDEQGDVWVNFAEIDYTAKYAQDALLTLSPKTIMLSGIASNSKELTANEKLEIYEVFALTANRKYEQAITQAMQSESLQFYCLTNFDSYIEMIEHRRNTQKQQRGRSI